MKKQLVIIGIAILLISVGLSGCTDNNDVPSKVNKEKILGQWTETIPNTPIMVIMNFFTNGSFYEGINETTVIWGIYTMTGKTIALQYGEVIHTVKYSFSDNDNTLTLNETDDGGVYLVLSRQSPNIQFEKDGGWLRVISVDREVNWSDVNITISAGNYSDIQFSPAPQMSMTYSYENGTTCPDKWLSITSGNALHFLLFNDNITVRLKWIRTNKIIGEWNFP